MSDSNAIFDEARQQILLFKNALGYTLAFQALTNSVDTRQSFVSLGLSVAIVLFIIVVLRDQLRGFDRSIFNDSGRVTRQEPVLVGVIRSGHFFLDVVVNVLTQFLSTIIGRYIIEFSPDLNNLLLVVFPIILLTFTLLWTLLLSLGAERRRT